jgi:hypothetical protein
MRAPAVTVRTLRQLNNLRLAKLKARKLRAEIRRLEGMNGAGSKLLGGDR